MRTRLLMTLAALALVAAPTSALADTTPAYNFEDVRNGIVDANGAPVPAPGKCTESYVDRTCPGNTLVAHLASGLGYVGHTGKVPPGSVVTVSYRTAGGLELHGERLTVASSGAIRHTATDLRSFMSPGDTLRIQVVVSNGGVTPRPTAVEYVVMLAL